MPLLNFLTRPATIWRRLSSTDRDAYGNEIPELDDTDTVWELQPRSASENEDEVSDAGWVGYFAPGTAIGTGDYVEDGEGAGFFEVDGDPEERRNSRLGAFTYVRANLRQVGAPEDLPAEVS